MSLREMTANFARKRNTNRNIILFTDFFDLIIFFQGYFLVGHILLVLMQRTTRNFVSRWATAEVN